MRTCAPPLTRARGICAPHARSPHPLSRTHGASLNDELLPRADEEARVLLQKIEEVFGEDAEDETLLRRRQRQAVGPVALHREGVDHQRALLVRLVTRLGDLLEVEGALAHQDDLLDGCAALPHHLPRRDHLLSHDRLQLHHLRHGAAGERRVGCDRLAARRVPQLRAAHHAVAEVGPLRHEPLDVRLGDLKQLDVRVRRRRSLVLPPYHKRLLSKVVAVAQLGAHIVALHLHGAALHDPQVRAHRAFGADHGALLVPPEGRD
mmetsp:Transcript_53101/g.139592  ORF Transcript_53101/g.139592 Transcript_53101/m.139592 type:complete len:263 (-) Transcript_53101:1011-1799(-)